MRLPEADRPIIYDNRLLELAKCMKNKNSCALALDLRIKDLWGRGERQEALFLLEESFALLCQKQHQVFGIGTQLAEFIMKQAEEDQNLMTSGAVPQGFQDQLARAREVQEKALELALEH